MFQIGGWVSLNFPSRNLHLHYSCWLSCIDIFWIISFKQLLLAKHTIYSSAWFSLSLRFGCGHHLLLSLFCKIQEWTEARGSPISSHHGWVSLFRATKKKYAQGLKRMNICCWNEWIPNTLCYSLSGICIFWTYVFCIKPIHSLATLRVIVRSRQGVRVTVYYRTWVLNNSSFFLLMAAICHKCMVI